MNKREIKLAPIRNDHPFRFALIALRKTIREMMQDMELLKIIRDKDKPSVILRSAATNICIKHDLSNLSLAIAVDDLENAIYRLLEEYDRLNALPGSEK